MTKGKPFKGQACKQVGVKQVKQANDEAVYVNAPKVQQTSVRAKSCEEAEERRRRKSGADSFCF